MDSTTDLGSRHRFFLTKRWKLKIRCHGLRIHDLDAIGIHDRLVEFLDLTRSTDTWQMNGRSIELIEVINIFQDIQGSTNILWLTDILELIQAGILLFL